MQRLVISEVQFLDASRVHLTAEQRHYLLSVLRMRPGDRLIVLNGLGQAWVGTLADESEIALQEPYALQTECPMPIKLVAALPKNGFDEVVRCVTELGVTHIYPVISERTVLKPSDNKLQRWRKIATEAAEQSERLVVPTIETPQPFLKLLHQLPPDHTYLCGAREKSLHLLDALPDNIPPEITLLIGPEGGWAEAEIQQAIAQNIPVVSLGKSILRAVTASITAIALVNGYYRAQF
ncbi:16S rRNA (uracil(1498)-N(3))-methyltransferase [Picosynechococcus sp. NKBG15041c]|uniref:16S rRNA (uracil(1498)-N(3))-methyltransferase n=1 Tax=Picosynechococcus sp. NKBG15041c TaxID=1407650 RepID=UPI000418B2B9|nr:16S rRNA (uracil(1498)-N(3))-methyltransferase [Picosynechococcus sp. NKBG15041c]